MPLDENYKTKFQQHPKEIDEFIKYLRKKQIQSFLEIGSKFGGALWRIVQNAMPCPSKIVSVDLPNSRWGRSDSEHALQSCFDELKRLGHNAHVFFGDSTDPKIVEQVKQLAPYDAVFIDANHTEPFVRADFKNYGRLTKILCFHDIGWTQITPPGRLPIEVPKVWRELKDTFKHEAEFLEIKMDNGHNGIGIMQWR